MTTLAVLPLIVLAFVLIVQDRYQIRMLKMGIGVITEAQAVKAEYPDEYGDYYERAVQSLNDHGVGELVAALPRLT